MRTPQDRRRPYQKHGFYALKNAIQKYNQRGLPGTLEGAMRERREALVNACGGPDAVSPQRLVLIEKIAMRISGHLTEAMFSRYNIDTDEDTSAAVDKLSAYVDAIPATQTIVPIRAAQ